MMGAGVFRIGIANQPVEALGVDQAAGAMMGHRGRECLLGTAPVVHREISKTKGSRFDVSRTSGSVRGPNLSHRGFRRPRPVDRRAARASTGTPYYMRCSRRDE